MDAINSHSKMDRKEQPADVIFGNDDDDSNNDDNDNSW